MKILVVSSSVSNISPRSMRTAELVNELTRLGHLVTLYSVLETNKPLLVDNSRSNLILKDLGEIHYKKIKAKQNKFSFYTAKIINRLSNLLFEYPDIEYYFKVKRAIKNEAGYDMMISIAVPYPIHWGCASVLYSKKNSLCKIWVADCGDPYMGDRTDTFRKAFYFKYIEKWFCRIVDYLTIPLKEAKSGYYAEFWNKIKIIPQGLDFAKVKICNGKINNAVPTFIYAGVFIPGRRDPSKFLEYLSNINKDFRFIIFTKGNGETLLKPYLNQLKDKIEIRDYINREDLILLMSKADFLINFDNNTSIQLPSKLIDYALAGRPILNITSVFDSIVVQEFLNGDYTNRYIVNGIEKYDIRNVAKQFLALYDEGSKNL